MGFVATTIISIIIVTPTIISSSPKQFPLQASKCDESASLACFAAYVCESGSATKQSIIKQPMKLHLRSSHLW